MDKFFQPQALLAAFKEAKKAALKDEVPVGAVALKEGKIIARSHNLKEGKKDPTGHAEILLIRKLCRRLSSWRLENIDVYITLEPCPMCLGALQQARVRNVYYGARDLKGGAISLGYAIHSDKRFNHRFECLFAENSECSKILSDYFKTKRKK